MKAALVAAVVLSATAARADDMRELYTHFTHDKPDDIKELKGWRMPEGFGVTHVILGRGDRGQGHVVVLVCDAKECNGRAIPLFNAKDVLNLGVVDLKGKPGALSERPPVYGMQDSWRDVEADKLAWPALIIRTRESHEATGQSRVTRGEVKGFERHGDLLVLSLAAKDLQDPVMFHGPLESLGATGAGETFTYRLERGEGGVLAIIAHLQHETDSRSKCLPPKPVEFRIELKDRKYVDPDPLGHLTGGC